MATQKAAISRTIVAMSAVVVVAVAAIVGVTYLSAMSSQGLPSTTDSGNTSQSTFQSICFLGGTVIETAGPSDAICGSFTYAPAGQVRVDSVEATQSVCHNCGAVDGSSYVSFAVTVDNMGVSPVLIYTTSAGISTSVSANSTVLQKVPSSTFCLGTISLAEIKPGENLTMSGPTSCTGFYYQVVGRGIVNVSFDFAWGNSSNGETNNETTISAQFNFQ